jgi:ParB family transcriptional regulator, chromosome partitioning protein
MNKRPLGRGLNALLSTVSSPVDNEEVLEVELDLIRPNRQQPRTHFDEAKLEELAQSIRTSGIIQPLLVRRAGGFFELIAGERRWRAAQLAGLSRVPAIVRDIPEDRILELALIENIQRQELNPVEEANAYRKLIESLHLTQEEIAERVGRDRTFITNYLRILKLPAEIQSLLESEKLSFGHARALLAIEDAQTQRRFAQRIIKHSWSVRETERRVKHLDQQKPAPPKRAAASSDPNIRAAEARLRRHLQTQVRIVSAIAGNPGRIEIEYYDLSDLNRLYELIITGPRPASSTASASASF